MKSLSRVRLFATPWTVAYQAPLSMGFSRQECWSGLPFPSPGDLPNPGIEPGSPALQADALPPEPPRKPLTTVTAKSLQSCPTLCDSIDGSPPGPSIHGIFQARVLEWGALAFSEIISIDQYFYLFIRHSFSINGSANKGYLNQFHGQLNKTSHFFINGQGDIKITHIMIPIGFSRQTFTNSDLTAFIA